MKKVVSKRATGFLNQLVNDIDEKEMAKTRNRMMIAAKIADALQYRGLSKKDFAQLMGKSPTVVTEWLSGDRNFTIDTLTEISEALHIRLLDTTSVQPDGRREKPKQVSRSAARVTNQPSGVFGRK